MWPHDANSPTNPSSPRPIGYCDRCNFRYYLEDLQWQLQWSASSLYNTFLRVCCRCMDIPQEQLRVIVIGPDPVPLKDPRPGFQQAEEAASGIPPVPPFVTEDDT